MSIDNLLFIPGFIIVILLVLYLLWVTIPGLSGLPWIPTRPNRIRRALELAHVSPGEIVYDLGSGDGRVLLLAAREFGAQAIGVEISLLHCLVARLKVIFGGVKNNVSIRWASYYKVDFSDADVIYIYITSREAARLRPYLENQLRSGTRIISISCEITGWQPVLFNRDELIFIYRMGSFSAK